MTTPTPPLSHLNSAGEAHMVDVSEKSPTLRQAIAEGFVLLHADTLRAIADDRVPKGEVLNTARIAGILAAKRTGDLIPLCHPLTLDSIEVTFDIPELEPAHNTQVRLRICATARITAKTGVEMEALTAIAMSALTIYDMCKAIDKSMVISDIKLLQKTGGKSSVA